jgi:hypothetical protein
MTIVQKKRILFNLQNAFSFFQKLNQVALYQLQYIFCPKSIYLTYQSRNKLRKYVVDFIS